MSRGSKVGMVLGACVVACACTRAGTESPPTEVSSEVASPPMTAADQALGAPGTERLAAAEAGPPAPPPGSRPDGVGREQALTAMAAARKLIRSGQMTLTVESYGRAADEVKRIAETHGGYLAEAQASRGQQDHQHGTLTIRVAADRFDAAVAAVRALGQVRNEATSTQDVTKTYADLETRLRVKRDASDRLRDILRTRTAKLSDVLEAERELARITEEIERMEGERRFYDQQVAMSSLTVTLQEPSALVVAGAFSPLSEALRDSLRVLAQSLAALVYWFVFLAPWLVLAWVVWRVVRRARARRSLT